MKMELKNKSARAIALLLAALIFFSALAQALIRAEAAGSNKARSYKVTFLSEPANAKISVKNKAGTAYVPSEGDVPVYKLPAGEYVYSAMADGYEACIDIPFTVDREDLQIQFSLVKNGESGVLSSAGVQETERSIEHHPNEDLPEPQAVKSGSRRDVARYITNFTVTPTEIYSGSNVKLHLDFKDTDDSIKEGDYIEIKWQNIQTHGQSVFFKGYQNTLPLNDSKNRHIADITIYDEKAVITFTDVATKLHDIEGFVEFEVQGHDYTPPLTEAHQGYGRITAGNHYRDVLVKRTKPGLARFFYKTGGMDPEMPNEVRWSLLLNNHREDIGAEGIYVMDEVQYGHEFRFGSFEIELYDVDYEATTRPIPGHENDPDPPYPEPVDSFYGADAIERFEKKYPGSRIALSGDKKHFQVIIPQKYAKGKHFHINYLTDVRDDKLQYFVNSAALWYTDALGNRRYVPETKKVKNVHFNAGATGTVRGELKVKKILVGGEQLPIEKVRFALRRVDGGAIQNGQTQVILTTDRAGMAGIKNLPFGEYILKEISAPGWVKFDPNIAQEMRFEITDADIEGIFFTIENSPRTIAIEGDKLWKDNPSLGDPRPDHIIIRLIADAGTDKAREVAQKRVTAADRWHWKFEDIQEFNPDGTRIRYSIKEDPVPGYITEIDRFNVTNTYDRTKIEGEKIWRGEPEEGAKRPQSITIRLFIHAGTDQEREYRHKVVTAKEHWRWRFDNLKKYNEDGSLIRYAIKEDPVPGYMTEIDHYDAVNTYVVPKKAVYTGGTTTSIDGKRVMPGQILTYAITHTNTAGDNAEITITDVIPPHTTFISAAGNGQYNPADRKITWIKSGVAQNEVVKVTFDVKVDSDVNGSVLKNIARIEDGKNHYETNETSNPTPPKLHKLPSTGGIGSSGFLVIGAALITLSAVMLMKKRSGEA